MHISDYQIHIRLIHRIKGYFFLIISIKVYYQTNISCIFAQYKVRKLVATILLFNA